MSLKKDSSSELPPEKEDLDPILKPLTGETDAGISLLYEGTYDKIREARREDDPALPQGVWKKALKVANFKEVEKLTTDALARQSKDFQLMAWLIEAWFELYQLEGLIRGFKILNGLCSRFWETGYPILKEGDSDHRLAPFHWLNEKFSERIPEIFITDTSLSQPKAYRFSHWKEALSLEKQAQKSEATDFLEKAAQEGRPISRDLQKVIAETSSTFYATCASQLQNALQEIEILEKFLLSFYDVSEISLYKLKRGLKDVLDLIAQIQAERGENEIPIDSLSSSSAIPSPKLEKEEEGSPPALEDKNEAEKISSQKESFPTIPGGFLAFFENSPLQTRAEAYDLLRVVETYLMDKEPHSPAPYLIKRALKWEHMNLEDIFHEILDETSDLNQLLTLLGMQKQSLPST